MSNSQPNTPGAAGSSVVSFMPPINDNYTIFTMAREAFQSKLYFDSVKVLTYGYGISLVVKNPSSKATATYFLKNDENLKLLKQQYSDRPDIYQYIENSVNTVVSASANKNDNVVHSLGQTNGIYNQVNSSPIISTADAKQVFSNRYNISVNQASDLWFEYALTHETTRPLTESEAKVFIDCVYQYGPGNSKQKVSKHVLEAIQSRDSAEIRSQFAAMSYVADPKDKDNHLQSDGLVNRNNLRLQELGVAPLGQADGIKPPSKHSAYSITPGSPILVASAGNSSNLYVTTTGPEGETVLIDNRTGNAVMVSYPNDSGITLNSDGTYATNHLDGSRELVDSTTGEKLVVSNDGVNTLYDQYGNTILRMNGTDVTYNTDGTIVLASNKDKTALFGGKKDLIEILNDITGSNQTSATQSENNSGPLDQTSSDTGTSKSALTKAAVDARISLQNTDVMSTAIGNIMTFGMRVGEAALSKVQYVGNFVDWLVTSSEKAISYVSNGISSAFNTVTNWLGFGSGSSSSTTTPTISPIPNIGPSGNFERSYTPAAAVGSFTVRSNNSVYIDPLLLDLDGDGVKMTDSASNPVLFDTTHSGSLHLTGWVSKNDGILVADTNNLVDHRIDISQTISEYYGGQVGTNGESGTKGRDASGKEFKNGFDALKTLDVNNDGVFNSNDSALANLRVWVDANHDGVVNAGELKTFADLGITAINLTHKVQSGEIRDGNEVQATGTFVMNGATTEMLSANFLSNMAGSTFTTDNKNNGTVISTVAPLEIINGADANSTNAKLAASKTNPSTTSFQTNITTGTSLDANTLNVINLYGNAGDDTLTAVSKGSTLDNTGSWLIGGGGSNTYNGGTGNDVFIITANDKSSNIHGGGGTDMVVVVGSAGVNLNLSQAQITIAEGGTGDDYVNGEAANDNFVRLAA